MPEPVLAHNGRAFSAGQGFRIDQQLCPADL
jgi:hypothetical protein